MTPVDDNSPTGAYSGRPVGRGATQAPGQSRHKRTTARSEFIDWAARAVATMELLETAREALHAARAALRQAPHCALARERVNARQREYNRLEWAVTHATGQAVAQW